MDISNFAEKTNIVFGKIKVKKKLAKASFFNSHTVMSEDVLNKFLFELMMY